MGPYLHRVIVGILALTAIVLIVSVVAPRRTTFLTRTDDTRSADTAEIIEARRVLMRQVQRLMQPIDVFTVDGNGDADAVRSAAETIEAMMLAFPHLFPPATNLYDPSLREPPTIALPAVWETFATFRTLAERSERAAAAVTASTDATALRTATQEDLDFDFDAVLRQN
jgi:cytochrome c556